MRRAAILVPFVAVVAFGPYGVGSVQGTVDRVDAPDLGSGWGELASGAEFAPVEEATAEDLAAVAALVRVTRLSYGDMAGLSGTCHEPGSGGPHILHVESGALTVTIHQPQAKAIALPVLRRRAMQGAPSLPASVVPGTRVTLNPGDLLAMPSGTECGILGSDKDEPPAVFLEVVGFPSGPPPTSYEQYDMLAEPLDVNLGAATANPPAPPVVVAGRLTLAPGTVQPLKAQSGPVLFLVETGVMELTADSGGGLLRRSGTELSEPGQPISRGETTKLGAGDGGYLPPGGTGAVRNRGDGPLVLLSVAVVPGDVGAGTPEP